MNILLWVLQILLALYSVEGGVYMMGHYKILASAWAANNLSAPVWIALGMLEVVFAVGLVLPDAVKVFHKLTPISAVGLAIISLVGIVLYDSYTGLGILWALVPAIVLAFVAYGRRSST